MNLKEGVLFDRIHAATLYAMAKAEEIMGPILRAKKEPKEPTVTALMDGHHMATSLHYVGLAVDIRSHDLTAEEIAQVTADLKKALGGDYDVIMEATGTNAHYHIEVSDRWLAANGDPRKGVA